MTTPARFPPRRLRPLRGSVLAVLIAFAPAAQAYRTTGELPEFAGTERVRWQVPAIPYTVHPDFPGELESSELKYALDLAFGAWSAPVCSALRFVNLDKAPEDAAPADGVNTVQWLRSGWIELGAPADAAALTDVQYERGPNGQWSIVEADLYLNAEDHAWTLDGSFGARDVRAVVTHEAGHIGGLLHPCELDGEDGGPSCDDHPEAAETTMFPAYSPVQKTLSADDEAGVCYLYPKTDGGSVGGEVGVHAPFGAPCSEAAGCVDGQCLAGLTDEPVCTRLCGGAIAPGCPSGWECNRVQDRDVCAPKPQLVPTGGGGCRLSGEAPDAGPRAAFFLCIAFAAIGRRLGRVFGARKSHAT